MRNSQAARHLHPAHNWLLPVVLVCFTGLRGQAQTPPTNGTSNGSAAHGRRSIAAVRVQLPVSVDGSLDEPAWREARASADFLQQEPREGAAASERTEFRVLHTATTLYIGVMCYDSSPQGILATERRRDDNLDNDDSITLVLDTFHDHRNSYRFRTNPLGTQSDALITDEGKNINSNWDEKWDVAARITEAGWSAEFAIPFKSLRLNEQDGSTWGFDIERIIRRKTEFAFWNGYRRGFDLVNVSQAGHLQGIENIETGLRLRVKPYFLAGGTQSVRRIAPASDQFRTKTLNASDAGMEVVKYRITPSLTADLTLRTDFAQTEVDDLIVNLERFPLFFAEKREFFQEGAGIFEFGNAQREADRELKMFHSRRIGLSPRGQTVPIVAGGRITGKFQGMTLGLLDVQTKALRPEDNPVGENVPASNFAVVRLKRDILSRSTVGAFLVNTERGGSREYSRVYGVDSKLVFHRYFTTDLFLAKSTQPGVQDNQWAGYSNSKWDSDSLLAGIEYFTLSPKFRDDLGFILRPNVRRISPSISLKPRPRLLGIRQIELNGRWEYIMDQTNRLVERVDHYSININMETGDVFRTSPLHHYLDRLEKDFEIRAAVKTPDGKIVKPAVVIPAGDYSWNLYSLRFTGSSKRRFSGFAWFSHRYGYYKGNYYYWEFSPKFRWNEHLSLGADYKINDIDLPGGSFTDHTINSRINYSFNNRWLASTTIQYDRGTSFIGYNFRLNYIYRPGDDFFLIYNETRRFGGAQDGQKDRALATKLTYSFDF